jgi:hypothetical protein
MRLKIGRRCEGLVSCLIQLDLFKGIAKQDGSKKEKKEKKYKKILIDDVFGKKITVTSVDVEYRSGYRYFIIFAMLNDTDIRFETSSTVLEKQLESLKNHLPAMGIINKVPIYDGSYYNFVCIQRKEWMHNTTFKKFIKQGGG